MDRITLFDKHFELFLDEEMIEKRIRQIAIQINIDYEDKNPIIIGVLNGSFLFMADLVKELDIPCEMAFIKVSSYSGMASSGQVKALIGLPSNLADRNVLIIEDIIDTGLTMQHIVQQVKTLHVADIQVCSMLFKPEALQYEVPELKYIAFEIPNEFVVGYGLDYNEQGRNLKNIYRLEP